MTGSDRKLKEVPVVSLHTYKPQTVDGKDLRSLVIHFDIPVDVLTEKTLSDAKVSYAGEGKLVVDHLLKHVPGGLVDAICVELLRHRASILSRAYADLP